MKKTLLCITSLILAMLMCAIPVFASASSDGVEASDASASLSSKSYFLMDGDTGATLSEYMADTRLPMASTTKIMTCLVALEEGDVNAVIEIGKESVGIEGSSIYLVEGERLTLSELLYGLMLESANDAAVAIAVGVSGNVDAFVDKMNAKAKEIGLENTHFCNPNGLQDEDHYSTARDLSLLMGYAMKNPLFVEISSTRSKSISAFDGNKRYLANHNKLLRTYEYCVAGKTGYTKTAGRCLVTAARRDGKLLICTTLGAPNDWNDHEELYRYGFSLYTKQNLASVGSIQCFVPVVGGTVSEISVSNSASIDVFLREGEELSFFTELPVFVYAPVTSGDYLGDAVYTLDGVEIARIGLYADSSAEPREGKESFWEKIWNMIRSWFE